MPIINYPTNLKPSTILVRRAFCIGKIDANIPITRAAITEKTIVIVSISNMGNYPLGINSAKAAIIGKVSARPKPPPIAEIINDSPIINPTK